MLVNNGGSHPRWTMDGNYTSSLPMRLAAADTLVLIDYPRPLCLVRAFKRLLMYRGRTRPDMGAACPERLNFSFLRWIWNYPKGRAAQTARTVAKPRKSCPSRDTSFAQRCRSLAQ